MRSTFIARQMIDGGARARTERLDSSPGFSHGLGLKILIESFYRSLREDAAVPIPYREILLGIMDTILDQLRDRLPTQPAPSGSWADLAFRAQAGPLRNGHACGEALIAQDRLALLDLSSPN